MSSARVATRPPLVLIADSHEWFSRALETVLVPGGYRVVKAYTARGALQQVEASLRESSPRYAALTEPQPLTAAEVQARVLAAARAKIAECAPPS